MMPIMKFLNPARGLAVVALLSFSAPSPTAAHGGQDNVPRIAVMSAYAPEMTILRKELNNAVVHSVNGVDFTVGTLEKREVVLFLTGISVVNAAMTAQLVLDNFNVTRLVFSGIAGGVDPALNIGDVIIADRWGQYLEMLFARKVEGGWEKPSLFEYPYANFGMMFPRSVAVQRAGTDGPETRFWFAVDDALLASARSAVKDIKLNRCSADNTCLEQAPRIVIGGPGVSGGVFIDNAEFRDYTFRTFGARVLDMESAAVAHVAWANQVPFIAVRSLSDLAGGSADKNHLETFFRLAASNAATVVKALLRTIPR